MSTTAPQQAPEQLRFGWARKTPMIYQRENAECALACLAMVAGHHGLPIDLPRMQQRFGNASTGVSLWRLVEMAQAYELQARPLQIELESLGNLQLPCVLHWSLNHFVVLSKVRRGVLVIHDPLNGVQNVPLNEASKQFTGIALELTPGPKFVPAARVSSISLRSLLGKIVGLKRSLAQLFLLSVALEVLALLTPLFTQIVLDEVIADADTHLLSMVAIGFVLVCVSQMFFGAVRAWSVTRLSSILSLTWATNVFSHLLKLPPQYFYRRHLGDIVSRFGAVSIIQQTITTKFVGVLLDGAMSCLALILMILYSPILAAITVGAVGCYMTMRLISYRLLRDANEAKIISAAVQQSHFLESIRTIQTIKLNNLASAQCARYANKTADVINKDILIQRYGVAFGSAGAMISGLQTISILAFGAVMVMNGEMSAGMLVAFFAYSAQFMSRSNALVDYAVDLRMLQLQGERLADIVMTACEEGVDTGYQGPRPSGSVEMKNVNFRYSDDAPWILEGCNLAVENGQSIAITGPSGCGKTTLAKLLVGLLDPESGNVCIGGLETKILGKSIVRSMVGAVLQDDQLFAGTIFDNITLFDTQATAERVSEVCALAAIDDDIAHMSMGYHSLVGDMGSSLSGGQKQRVLLARALFKNPEILLLDEATSHLDVLREAQVNASIKRAKITRIIIAHRAETIASADRVLELKEGRLTEVISPLLVRAV